MNNTDLSHVTWLRVTQNTPFNAISTKSFRSPIKYFFFDYPRKINSPSSQYQSPPHSHLDFRQESSRFMMKIY